MKPNGLSTKFTSITKSFICVKFLIILNSLEINSILLRLQAFEHQHRATTYEIKSDNQALEDFRLSHFWSFTNQY
jgi:arylamine N-acetyltransferase